MNRLHDVEGEFTLDRHRSGPVFSGYRPVHKLYNNYLSSGQHHYLDTEQVLPGQTAKVKVWLITPEYYPACLWLGREVDVMEGAINIVGKLKISKIITLSLAGSAESYSPHWIAPPDAID